MISIPVIASPPYENHPRNETRDQNPLVSRDLAAVVLAGATVARPFKIISFPAARLGASFRRPDHGALLRLALRCACEAGCGLRGHQRARLAAMRTIASFKRMIRLRRDPLLKGRGGGCFCVVAAIEPHRHCRSIAAVWAVMLCAHCGPPAPWSSSMPLTGIVELSSLNEGERGQTTSEAIGTRDANRYRRGRRASRAGRGERVCISATRESGR